MKDIADIRNELERTPNAVLDPMKDPGEKPRASREVLSFHPGSYFDISVAEQSIGPPASFRVIDTSVQEKGLDVLAWYSSFHVYKEGWGIYILTSSLSYLADFVLGRSRLDEELRRQVAMDLLLEHEAFHLAADYACAQFEMLTRENVWVQHAQLRTAGFTENMQETAANSYMLRRLSRYLSPRVMSLVSDWTRTQPVGYNEGADWMEDSSFEAVVRETLKSYLRTWPHDDREISPEALISAVDYSQLFPLEERLTPGCCPVYIVHDYPVTGLPSLSVKQISCMPQIAETPRFQKSLRGLPAALKRKWEGTKQLLGQRIPPYPQFEKMKGFTPTVYSVRLNKGYRAHIRQMVNGIGWEAFDVGTHDYMEH